MCVMRCVWFYVVLCVIFVLLIVMCFVLMCWLLLIVLRKVDLLVLFELIIVMNWLLGILSDSLCSVCVLIGVLGLNVSLRLCVDSMLCFFVFVCE